MQRHTRALPDSPTDNNYFDKVLKSSRLDTWIKYSITIDFK